MLAYLDFETSDDGEGTTCFDAMAYARAERWPALQAEVEQLLLWCTQEFGRPGPLDNGQSWDWDLQLQSDAGHPLAACWDASSATLAAPDAARCAAVQLSLTISGNESFAQALVAQFLDGGA